MSLTCLMYIIYQIDTVDKNCNSYESDVIHPQGQKSAIPVVSTEINIYPSSGPLRYHTPAETIALGWQRRGGRGWLVDEREWRGEYGGGGVQEIWGKIRRRGWSIISFNEIG